MLFMFFSMEGERALWIQRHSGFQDTMRRKSQSCNSFACAPCTGACNLMPPLLQCLTRRSARVYAQSLQRLVFNQEEGQMSLHFSSLSPCSHQGQVLDAYNLTRASPTKLNPLIPSFSSVTTLLMNSVSCCHHGMALSLSKGQLLGSILSSSKRSRPNYPANAFEHLLKLSALVRAIELELCFA